MGDLAIRIENLGKQYRIGTARARNRTFREALIDGVTGPVKRLRGLRPPAEDQTIWALRDVSFEVKRGEVLGIIGRNGAGKTTVLKILSRITEPTEGHAEIRGRVGSLLEVGTGFHPELSGRENVYLNGAILGMGRAEIQRKFDEIVAFSEIERFIDTPVKHYSTGMYMRLAFAVAAHLEPDILLIDEVLAVGDAAFQRKCLSKMDEVAKEGRTVLFVSHNMAAVAHLCGRGILLENGYLTCAGSVDNAINKYQMAAAHHAADGTRTFAARTGSGLIRFKQVAVRNKNGEPRLYSGCGVSIKMELESATSLRSHNLTIGIGINSPHGDRLVTLLNKFDPHAQARDCTVADGTVVVCNLSRLPLRPGVYYLSFYIDINGEVSDASKDAIRIEIQEADFYGTGIMPSSTQGVFVVDQAWHYSNRGVSEKGFAVSKSLDWGDVASQ